MCILTGFLKNDETSGFSFELRDFRARKVPVQILKENNKMQKITERRKKEIYFLNKRAVDAWKKKKKNR